MNRRALLMAGLVATALVIDAADRSAAAAIALRAVASGSTGNTTSTTVAIPTGTLVGDVTLVAAVQTYSAGVALSTPAGWTALFNNANFCVVYRVAQLADPTSVTVTSNNVGWVNSFAISYSGTDATAPIDTSCACPMQNFAAYRAPALAPNFVGGVLVGIFLNDPSGGGAIVVPGGMTTRVSSAYGPSGLVADAAMPGGGAASPDYTATGGDPVVANYPAPFFGMAVVLKTAGASPASNVGRATFAGLYTFEGGPDTTVSVPFGPLAPRTGDLLCALITTQVTVTSGPAGWALQQTAGPSASNTTLWTHGYTAGDGLTPAWVLPSATHVVVGFVLRATPGGSPVALAQASGTAGGSGTGSATSASLTPATALELLILAYGDGASPATTWATEPTGPTIDLASVAGPCILFAWQHAASNPTGAYTAAVARTSDTISATAMLFGPPAASRAAGGSSVI